MTRDELVECSALLAGVRAGRLDAIHPPEAPLDILAQQIVAECAAERWRADDLFDLVRRAAPYAGLTPRRLRRGRGPGRRRHRDRPGPAGRLPAPRPGQRRAVRPSRRPAGRAHLRRRHPRDRRLPGGGRSRRHLRRAPSTRTGPSSRWPATSSCSGRPRGGSGGSSPAPCGWSTPRARRPRCRSGSARRRPAPAELSEEVSALRAEVDAASRRRRRRDRRRGALGRAALRGRRRGGRHGRAATWPPAGPRSACCPTSDHVVIERFFDDSGGMQLVVHAPFGGRVNRALGLALRKRFCVTFDFELQAAASDDAVLLSLGPQHSFPLESVTRYLSSATRRRACCGRRPSPRRCSRPAGGGTSTGRSPSCASGAAARTRRRSSGWRPTT